MGWLAKGVVITGLLAVSAVVPTFAYEVQPMRHTLLPADGKTSSIITVKNTREAPLPVEPIFQKRTYMPDGSFQTSDGSADFLIFPPQALIAPGKTQSFRFQYIGEGKLPEEEAYTLLVKEVPVDLEEGFTGLRYLYDFGVAIYVEDKAKESKLSISGLKRNSNQLDFSVTNSSASFGRLENDRIRLSQDANQIDLEGTELTEVLTRTVIPPNSTIAVSMTLDDLDLEAGHVDIRLEEKPD